MDIIAKRKIAGVLAVLFYMIHGGALTYTGGPFHMIWSCHLGCLLVGVGLLFSYSWTYSIGFFWLCFGVPLWVLNVLTSVEFMLTSTLTHIFGFMIAIYGLKYIRIPRFSWAMATLSLIILGIISRLITPSYANVNMAFAVWSGWEKTFTSHFWYIIMLLSTSAIIFAFLEFILRRYTLWSKNNLYPEN